MATSNDNLLKQWIEAENARDVEKVLTLLTDDIVIEDVTFGLVMKGKDDFKQFYPTFITAAPDFKLEPKTWVTDDKSFAMEIVYSGTQKGDFPGLPATGKPFSIRTCSFGEFENGKIKGRRDYWDLVTLREQLLGKQDNS
ncbi:MAG: ketosteroid isomerase-related protein [Nitrososphaeraceae archaeon]